MIPLGSRLRIRRRTAWERAHRPALAEVARRLAEDGDGVQLAALASTLAASPFWAGRLRAAGLAPGDLVDVEDLASFPTIDRATYGAAWTELPVVGVDGVTAFPSSGTTGEPVWVVREPFDQLYMWGVVAFWLARLGLALPPRPRVVLLCALPSGLEYSVRVRAIGDGEGALHRLSLVRPRARERLEKAAPALLFADPAGLHWLASERPAIAPRLIATSAQRFAPAERARLAEAYAAPVVNYYATTETGPIAWECLEQAERFHVLTPDVWVESVDGELVVTRLRPTVVPLLRYRTGDAGEVVRDACPCGFTGWSITGFAGRRACRFAREDGVEHDAWQLAAVFKHHPLAGFCMEQVARDEFVVTLVLGETATGLVGELEEALRRLGWSAPRVRVTQGEVGGAAKPEPFRRSCV